MINNKQEMPIVNYLRGATIFSLLLATSATAGADQSPATPTLLPKLTVTDTVESPYVIPAATSGTKTDTPVMETPLNIQVVPAVVLQEQQALTLDQALTNISGVISNSFAQGQETIYVRGFIMNTTFLNGFRIEDNSTGLRTLTNAESIEVLKGPAAILYGAIEPGGMVNIVTKQPQATPAYVLEQGFGSWQHSLTNLNATGPLTHDGTLLYQVNLSYDRQNSWIDGVYDHKLFFAPTLQLNVGEATRVAIEAQFTHNPFVFDNVQALPYVNGQFVHAPLSTNLGVTMPYAVDTRFVQLRVSHEFNSDWAAKFQLGHNLGEASGITPSLADLAPSGYSYVASVYLNLTSPGEIKTTGTSLDVVGHFEAAGIKNKLLLGADYYRTDSTTVGAGSGITYSLDLFNPVYPGSPPPGLYPSDPNYGSGTFIFSTLERGLYVQDQLEFPYGIFATAGVRYDRIGINGSSAFFSPNPPPGSGYSLPSAPLYDSATTPRIGLLWKAKDWLSLYGNYSGNLSPNLYNTDYLGNALNPSRAKQFEGGLKAESSAGDLRATLAYYDLTKTNVPTTDPDPTHREINPGAQVLIGELGSKGVELDVQGKLASNWNVIATYAHLNVRVLKSADTSCAYTGSFCVGARFANVPADMASIWTTYEFGGQAAQGWKAGGGVVFQNSSTNQNNLVEFPGFAVVNAMISYTGRIRIGKLIAQLNLNNALDKYHFTGNYTNNGPPTYATVNFGAPRNVMASARIEF